MPSSNQTEPQREIYQRREVERTNVTIEIDGYPRDSWLALISVALQPITSNSVEGLGFEIIDKSNQVIERFKSLQAAREWLEQNGYLFKGSRVF